MDQNEDVFAHFMNEESFRKVVGTWTALEGYRRLERGAKNLGTYTVLSDR